jgi:dihydroorotate dehydrogenase electron transfer subunit
MTKSRIVPEKILHQPPPNTFASSVRDIAKTGKGHCGDYIIRGKVIEKNIPQNFIVPKSQLEKKIIEATKTALEIREGNSPLGSLLHSIYQELSINEILTFAQYKAYDFLKKSIEKYAVIKGNTARLITGENKSPANSKIKNEIREAFLDAKSLYVNDVDKQNQVYQRVLGKFQGKGITIGDIHIIGKNIQNIDVNEHRIKRIKELLYLFGRILNFKSIKRNGACEEVIWEANGNVKILFRIKDDLTLVNAVKTIPEEEIIADVGTISDKDLEYALSNWCERNPQKGDFLKKIIYQMEKSITVSSPYHLLLKVLENKQVCPQHYLITLKVPPKKDFDLIPGQFFHVICDPYWENTMLENGRKRGYPLTLRRPFSFYRVHYENFNRKILATPTVIPYELKKFIKRPIHKIDFLYKVVGIGTASLTTIKNNKHLDVIGPIGNGFNIEKEEAPIEKVVLVAGGIGVAPLVALAEKFRYLGSSVYLYYGALKKELLRLLRPDSTVSLGFANGKDEFIKLITNEFMDIGTETVKICTDDGSVGEKGPVTDVLEKDLKTGDLPKVGINLYTCGPLEMMKKVSKLAHEYNIPCQLLMEERMACGIGACFSCTCQVRSKNGEIERKRVCVDGPVFDSEDIKWEN